jgi:hypothetical protein
MLRLLKSTPPLAAFVDFICSSPYAGPLAFQTACSTHWIFALAEIWGAAHGGQELKPYV